MPIKRPSLSSGHRYLINFVVARWEALSLCIDTVWEAGRSEMRRVM